MNNESFPFTLCQKKEKKILTQNVVFYKNKKDKDLFFSSFISFED